jgi:hypothetical protein
VHVPVVSAIPASIDYLVSAIGALTECAAPCIVEDGWPTRSSPLGVAVGVIPGDDTTDDEVAHAQLGADMEWETFEIPCVVWAHVGAASAKTARDAAFTVFDAILAMVRVKPAGRTLGGALHSGVAVVHNVRVIQTGDAAAAGEGRMCEIRFSVGCKNRF